LGGGKNFTKYNKINNNSENFRGARLLPEGRRPLAPVSCGPEAGMNDLYLADFF